MSTTSFFPVKTRTAQEALREAVAHLEAGRLAEAERVYRKVLRQDKQNAEAMHGIGLLAQQLGDLPEAEKWMRAAIAANLKADVYRSNLGNVLQMQHRLEEAVQEYERGLMLRPDSAAALSNLGAALLSLGRAEEAVDRLRRAAALKPDSAQIADNLGNALQATGRCEEAVRSHERALELAPKNAETYGNLALALASLGRWDTAMASLSVGLGIDSSNARMQLARAQLQLLLGDYRHGLATYEWRKKVHGERQLSGREWKGEAIPAGETLLVYAEQGLGDTIQFLRYLPWLRIRLGKGVGLALEVQAAMQRLATQFGLPVTQAGDRLPAFDWHCSLVSLALYLEQQELDEQEREERPNPNEVPYLRVPEETERAFAFVERAVSQEKLKVGLVWAGNRAHARDRFRSIPFERLEPLLALDGVEMHSLQVGEDRGAGFGQLVDWSRKIGDMADTAAVIRHMDLVIGVDTAVIHLAGALGKTVWTMLPFWPDWRWGLERESTRWYPTMRLFRQQVLGDWSPVVEEVRRALLSELSRGHRVGDDGPSRA